MNGVICGTLTSEEILVWYSIVHQHKIDDKAWQKKLILILNTFLCVEFNLLMVLKFHPMRKNRLN